MKKKAKKATKPSAKVSTKTKPAAPRASAPANKSGVMPLGDRVLVKPLSPEEMEGATTSFGIIIPDTVSKEKPEQGTVVAVGPGKTTEDGRLLPVSVKPGDRVLFSKYGFDEVKVKGAEYYIVSESNILAVLQ
jgi:chaperonin GroES